MEINNSNQPASENPAGISLKNDQRFLNREEHWLGIHFFPSEILKEYTQNGSSSLENKMKKKKTCECAALSNSTLGHGVIGISERERVMRS